MTATQPNAVVVFRLAAAALAIGIFLIDTVTSLEGAVAVLYAVVVMLAAATEQRRDVIVAAIACVSLTVLAYGETHGLKELGSPALRAVVSLAAIAIATLLALRSEAATRTLLSQARLLNLSHDMIFVRDSAGVITFWNSAAEEIYGFSREEALGKLADDLLATRYPDAREAVEKTLAQTGRWEGTLEQRTRSGRVLVVESRWALQRDHAGRAVGILETDTDITERQAAHAALVESERRYRRMFDASRIGILEEDWSGVKEEMARLGVWDAEALAAEFARNPDSARQLRRKMRIVDVSPALLAMVGATTSGEFLASVDDIIDENDRTFPASLAAFARGDDFHEGETEIVGIDGRRIPVLFAIAFPGADEAGANVLVFVIDNTERKQAQNAVLEAQSELAHAARAATLGELTASIAHEVNQPLMAVVTSGEAGMRWLKRSTPDLQEVEAALQRIIAEGRRASDIVKNIRSFLKKAPARKELLDIGAVMVEASQLVEHELARARVDLRIRIAPDLPPLKGDRIQLQQVLVNLMVNAGQAMARQAGPRILSVAARSIDGACVDITVSDTGPGLAPEGQARVFDPFYTTKPEGMGMGLAICRTTAEAHDGKLSVESSAEGATFRLSLPVPGRSALQ